MYAFYYICCICTESKFKYIKKYVSEIILFQIKKHSKLLFIWIIITINIIYTSNPNDPSATPPPSPVMGESPPLAPDQTPYWDTYDTINQLYMEISTFYLHILCFNRNKFEHKYIFFLKNIATV